MILRGYITSYLARPRMGSTVPLILPNECISSLRMARLIAYHKCPYECDKYNGSMPDYPSGEVLLGCSITPTRFQYVSPRRTQAAVSGERHSDNRISIVAASSVDTYQS